MKKMSSLIPISRGIIGCLLFCLIWHISLSVSTYFFNVAQLKNFMPYKAFETLYGLLSTGFFWESVFSSLRRILIGLVFAFLLGVPAGLTIGVSKVVRHLTYGPIQFLRMISPISWMPVATLFLPGFEESILFIITIAAIWPLLINTIQGVQNVNPNWINMAKNQGANERQLLFKIIIPSSRPYIVTGLRLSIGVAWIVLVPAEMLGSSIGLGYLINDARDTMEYSKLTAVILAIGIIGSIIDIFFQKIKSKYEWKPRV